MQFNSYLFLFLFLPLTLAGYFGLYRLGRGRGARLFLTAASLIFFGYGNPWYVVLLAASALFNWWVSVRLTGRTITGIPRRADAGPAERADLGAGRPKPRGGGLSRGLLAFGILVNLGLLFYYKYFNFFIDNLNLVLKQDWVFSQVLLPAGISFFTFQQIAWLVDSYRQETGEYGFLDYLLFTVYFPKISMGPILLHGEFIPLLQEEKRRRPDPEYMARGLMMLAVGLFKKVILAEFFGGAVTWGYDNVASLSAPDAFCVMLAYTFQLYFDFSGYCDMAGGISRMLHLDLPQNFNSPYKALSPVDFWKRWHMTLTRFLRTYIYFPLGGSRRGTVRTYINIMVIFLVSGIWHGAAWTFIFWGLLHGLAQCAQRALGSFWKGLHPAFQWMCTFLFVNVGWVFFRAETIGQGVEFLKKMGNFSNMQLNPGFIESFSMVELPSIFQDHRIMTVALAYAAALCLVMNARNMDERVFRPNIRSAVGTAVLFVWSVLSLSGISTFIYFQF